MSDDIDRERNPDPGHPHGDMLPEESPTAGEAALQKGDVETDEPKAGKGGDHPTPGAGEHDDPSN
jgi:hypothetical protein